MMRALLMAGAVLFGVAQAADAAVVTYDAVQDFNTASNPNGVWSYGYGTATSNLTFTAFTSANSSYGSPSWNLSTLPLVGQAYTGGTVAVPSNDLWLHPGNADNLAAILRFTAQITGSYSLNGSFERADTVNGGGDGTAVGVYLGNALVFGSTLFATTGASYSLNNIFNLTAGDTLSFVVGRNGDYTYDSTGVRAVLSVDNSAPTTVPEPASLALLGIGVAGIAAARRRRAA